MVSGCGTVELFGTYDLPESPSVEATPYPRLVDTPTAPAAGSYTAAVPDPGDGARAQTDLAVAAAQAQVRAAELAGPVIPPAEKARIARAAKRRR